MSNEDKIILSFVFNRSGKTSLKKSEIFLTLSIELGWFSAKDAKNFVEKSIDKELLVKKGELFSLNFDNNNIEIPVGFKPKTTNALEKEFSQKEQNLLDKILIVISKNTSKTKDEILAEVENISNQKNILQEVAAIYLLKKYDINMSEFLNEIENIFR